MNITNHLDLPETVFRALTHSDYSRGNSNRSVTQLIDSPRVRILKKEHEDEITEDASDMVWSVLGTAVHKVFEQERIDGHVLEERLYAEVDNWTISGAIDVQRKNAAGTDVEILDYKCTSVWSVIHGKVEWENQLNFYAWLVEQSGKHISGLKIVAILRDYSRGKRFEKNYPEAPIVMIDIPLWSPEERDAYVRERVRLHQAAEFDRLTGEELPICTDAERWRKPTTYAVMSGKAKRAVRVFDEQIDAEKFLKAQPEEKRKAMRIEMRRGTCTRCADNWCRVAQWCDQWQAENKDAV